MPVVTIGTEGALYIGNGCCAAHAWPRNPYIDRMDRFWLVRKASAVATWVGSVLVVAACGGSGGSDGAPEPVPGTTAALAWDAPPLGVAVDYRVYYGPASGSYEQARGAGVLVGNRTSYSVQGLSKGQTYYFAVTAIDAQGGESPYSNEVTKTTN